LFKFGGKFPGRFANNRKGLLVVYSFSGKPPRTQGSHCFDGFYPWWRSNSELEGVSFFWDSINPMCSDKIVLAVAIGKYLSYVAIRKKIKQGKVAVLAGFKVDN
jgi:hypothetical protein